MLSGLQSYHSGPRFKIWYIESGSVQGKLFLELPFDFWYGILGNYTYRYAVDTNSKQIPDTGIEI